MKVTWFLEPKSAGYRNVPLSMTQCHVSDKLFRSKYAASMVRESKTPHTSITVCVQKVDGKWRLYMIIIISMQPQFLHYRHFLKWMLSIIVW